MLQLFANSFGIEHTLTLATFATDPLETVIFQELSHLHGLLFVVVTLDCELCYLINAVVTGGHSQLRVLGFQVRDLYIFFCQFFLES